MARTTFQVIFEPRPAQGLPRMIGDGDTVISTNDARQLAAITTWLDDKDQAYSVITFGGPIDFSTSIQENHRVRLVSLMSDDGQTVRFDECPTFDGSEPAQWDIVLAGLTSALDDQVLGQVELTQNGTYIVAAWLDDDGIRSVQVPQIASLVDAGKVIYAVRHEG